MIADKAVKPTAWHTLSPEHLAELVDGARVRSVETGRGGLILWLENDAGELLAGLPVGWEGCNPGEGGI